MSFTRGYFVIGGKDYSRFRPTYPGALAETLAALGSSQRLAIDVGCGTGQLSLRLAEHFDRVIATDGSQDQLANAAVHPKVEYRCEMAESMSAETGSADLVASAQAAHWFDLPRFYREVRRVAKPGAGIALISYGVPVIEDRVNAIFQKFYWQDLAPYWPEERHHVETGYRDLPFPFERLNPPHLFLHQNWNLDELIGYLSTWSAIRRASEAGRERLLSRFATDLAARWGEPGSTKQIRWPVSMRLGRIVY